jgi:peptidoglycan/LPS O-acetylase OafA/YrhL
MSIGNSHAKYLNTRSFGSLDGLRALSIMAVVWLHSAADAFQSVVLRRGFLGVDFFFIISGFLIVTLLLRERRQTGTVSLKNFYLRRSLRIVPVYWLMLAMALCVATFKPGMTSALIKHDLPYAFLYVSNLVPMFSFLSITWSLSTEEQFYLIIPWLQSAMPRAFPRIVLPCLYGLAVLPPFGVFATWQLPEFFRQTTFGPILLGVVLAYVLDSERGWSLVAKVLGNRFSPVVAFALLALAISMPGADIAGWPRLAMQLSMLVILASCVVREAHVLVPVLTSWPIRRIGTVSYGIYIYHLLVYWPIANLFGKFGISSSIMFFLADLLCTWALAELSYRLYESKFLTLKQKFASSPGISPKAAPETFRRLET